MPSLGTSWILFAREDEPGHTASREVTSGSSGKLPPSTDLGPQVNFTIWLLTSLSSALLALRIYCKLLRHRGLWWDDHFLIAAWLALVADCAFISACVNLGFGRPLSHFDPKNLSPFLLYSNLAGSFSILAASWSKTSFALTVLRISAGWVKALVWFIIVTLNACLGVAVAITWVQCTPVEKVWRPFLDGDCWPKAVQVRYNVFTAVYSGTMDIVLVLLPWKVISILAMSRKEKTGIMAAMSMGILAGITSFIKITQLPSIANSTFTESTSLLVIFGAAEPAITIMAASIPILRALIRDSPPPPEPARCYDSLSTVDDFPVYTGGPIPATTAASMQGLPGIAPRPWPSHVRMGSTSTVTSGGHHLPPPPGHHRRDASRGRARGRERDRGHGPGERSGSRSATRSQNRSRSRASRGRPASGRDAEATAASRQPRKRSHARKKSKSRPHRAPRLSLELPRPLSLSLSPPLSP
ncbi:hypothetical protein VTJ83DRAFT_3126 [Remersonia thermophila]|uniref:Rhodopsin domain-containing protein n=1 Tax=Remersonia thermophila TaxID=72144 RepID=A0ABR4DD58_9PEZI